MGSCHNLAQREPNAEPLVPGGWAYAVVRDGEADVKNHAKCTAGPVGSGSPPVISPVKA